jgi:hypothetical protein
MLGEGLMSLRKASGVAIFTACLLGVGAGSAHAECNNPCATEWIGGNVIN